MASQKVRRMKSRPNFLSGAVIIEAVIITVFALVLSRILRITAAFRPVQVSASALLVMGMVWFFLRLKG